MYTHEWGFILEYKYIAHHAHAFHCVHDKLARSDTKDGEKGVVDVGN